MLDKIWSHEARSKHSTGALCNLQLETCVYCRVTFLLKTTSLRILHCRGNVFTEFLPSSDKRIHRQTHKDTRPTIFLLLSVFTAAGTHLPSRCLAPKREIHFTEPLLNNVMRDTYTDAETDERDLRSTPLRWTQVSLYAYQVS
jgi:hypothetical protein